MGPKKESAKQNKAVSLDEEINTREWQCLVAFMAEKDTTSSFMVYKFNEAASTGVRREIKTITLIDIMRIIKSYHENALEYRFRFLMNFKSILDEACLYLKEGGEEEEDVAVIPLPLLAKLVKAVIRVYKEDDVERREKMKLPPIDPITAMKNRPMVPPGKAKTPGGKDKGKEKGKDKGKEKGKDKGKEKGKSKENKKSGGGGGGLKPVSPGKEETKLLKRGEQPKDTKQIIDDSPQDGFHLYICLSGFYEPMFTVELISIGVPIHGFLCVDSGLFGLNRKSSRFTLMNGESEEDNKINTFWEEFLKILWQRDLTPNFKEIIFQVYCPRNLPKGKEELQKYLFNDISFVLYDMSEVRRQQKNYFRHVKVWDVRANEEDYVELVEEYIDELGAVPCELINVPIMLQFILDNLCGEDGPDAFSEYSAGFQLTLPRIEFMGEDYQIDYEPIPKSSLLPTPNWSEILQLLDDDIRKSLHIKMKELDIKYEMLDEKAGYLPERAGSEINPFLNPLVDLIPRRRLPSPNLLKALNHTANGGNAGALWLYYSKLSHRRAPSEISLSSSVYTYERPQFLDYCLYMLWMTKVPCILEFQLNRSKSYSESVLSQLDSKLALIQNMDDKKPLFTITNCVRNILSLRPLSKYLGKDFFQSPDLKILSQFSMKALSCSDIRQRRSLPELVGKSFFSDINLRHKFLRDVDVEEELFDEIRTFLGEEMFTNSCDFGFVEELDFAKMLKATEDAHSTYLCMDHMYSELTDSIFIVFHNPMNEDCVYCKPFNVTLRTVVPLRDFFEYNMDDDREWLEEQEAIYQEKLREIQSQIPPNPFYFPTPDFRDFLDVDFMTFTSLKYQTYLKEHPTLATSKDTKEAKKGKGSKEGKKAREKTPKSGKGSKGEKEPQIVKVSSPIFAIPGQPYDFDAYDVDILGVQFSGFQTMFFSPENCTVRVELLERLYGDQEMGLHIRQGGHVLHLYSHVCPKPSLIQPHMFHLTLNNDVVIGFNRRFVKKYILKEVSEVRVHEKPKKGAKVKKEVERPPIFKTVSVITTDEDFMYELKLSLPSGLVLETVRDTMLPCYIRQYYVERPALYPELVKRERSRCFLTNGTVLKFMLDDSVEILTNNTTILEFDLFDFNSKKETDIAEESIDEHWIEGEEVEEEFILLEAFKVTTCEAYVSKVSRNLVISEKKLEVFRNTDIETSTCYYRRSDGTNYVYFLDGMFCVEYPDKTRVSSIFIIEDEEIFCDPYSIDEDMENTFMCIPEGEYVEGFTSVHIKYIMEHEDYATAIYESMNQEWTILLPFDTAIKITADGYYEVKMDPQTTFEMHHNRFHMARQNSRGEFVCESVIDLSVFDEETDNIIYCTHTDTTGKKFTVQSNAESYVTQVSLAESEIYGEDIFDIRTAPCIFRSGLEAVCEEEEEGEEKMSLEVRKRPSTPDIVRTGNMLKTNNRYFVLKRDLTGFELVSTISVREAVACMKQQCIDYSDILPGAQQLRYYTIICPSDEKPSVRRWKMKKITPRVKYDPRDMTIPLRSTYVYPPCWTHPFPKKKKIVQIPSPLSSRIFIETKPTQSYSSPSLGGFSYCQLKEVPMKELSILHPGVENLQTYFRKVASDDEALLRELYCLGCQVKIDAVRSTNRSNTAFLEHYLKMSEYYLEKQEYHKYMIRYKIVPNFFEHPAGMSFLILKDLADAVVKYSEDSHMKPEGHSESMPTISGTEIEYNLSYCTSLSLSSLSYRAGLDSKSGPLECTCKPSIQVSPRNTKSEPAYKITYEEEPVEFEGEDYDFEVKSVGTDYDKRGSICSFDSEDLKFLQKKVRISSEDIQESPYRMEDLLALGLI